MTRPKRFIITSAQSYASPHSHFLRGLEKYAKDCHAELVVLPMIGKSASEDWDNVHSVFSSYLEYGKKRLNSNLMIEQFNIRPYQIDPITSLKRFTVKGSTSMSLIFASPKQRLVPVAVSNQKYPKFLITTGACTRPNYADSKDSSAERRRLGDIARRDHVYGAVVVEIVNDELYHFRHVRANSEGEFVDLGKKYSGNKVSSASIEAMILGDWHNGMGDKTIENASYSMIKSLKPKRLVLHDFFDAHSISHHVEKQPIEQKLIQVIDKGHHILDRELEEANLQLRIFSELMNNGEIVIVHSNHHKFLNRYLEEARYYKDLSNFRTAVKILSFFAEKDYNDPVEYGIKLKGKLPKSIKFLKPDEDFKIYGYQLGAHGHNVPYGSGYGSMNTKENDWGKSITGHVHKAQILRNTYTVGTVLPNNMFYMRGFPSEWTHTHALLYNTGTVQLVNIFDGKWRA